MDLDGWWLLSNRMRPFPFLILPIAAAAKAHVSCQIPSAAGLSNTYDFSSLPQPVSLTHQLSTPPTTTTTHLRLILCGGEGDGLGLEEGVEETDQCPPQTTVCMRILNTKPNSEPEERTISVIPIAGSQIPGIDLPGQVTWAETPGICPDGKSDCMDLVGNFSGGEWNELVFFFFSFFKLSLPFLRDLTPCISGRERQKLTILMHCTTPADSLDAPTFLSYDANVLSLRWDTEHACPRSLDGEPDSPPGHPPKKSSFWGWFFFLFVLSLSPPALCLYILTHSLHAFSVQVPAWPTDLFGLGDLS